MSVWMWHQKAATAGTSRVPVVVVGSSTVAGMNATAADRRFYHVLARTLRARHNAPGVSGGIGVTGYGGGYFAHGWTRSGGTPVTSRGLGFTGWQMSAGEFIERTAAFTSVTVLFEQGPGAGPFQVSIDGGASTTVTPNTGAAVNSGTWSSGAVVGGTHTVRITAVGTCVFEGGYPHFGDESAGVHVHNGGLAGATTLDLANTPGLITRLAQMQPALVVLLQTSNDYADGVNPATTKSRCQTWLADLFAAVSPAPTVLLVHSYKRFDVTSPAFGWEQYGAVLRELADADPGRVAYVDLSGRYPASQAADTENLIDADDIHQTDAGHVVMADALADYLAMAVTYDAFLSRVRVSAHGLPAASVEVERSTDLVRWSPVRGGGAATVVGGAVRLDDYEFGADVANYYRVRTAGFADTFTRTVSGSWGGDWTNEGGTTASYSVSDGTGKHMVDVVGSSRRTLIGPATADMDRTVTVATSALAVGASQQASVMGRYQDLDNLYMLQARINTNQTIEARIVARVAGAEIELGVATVPGLTHVAWAPIAIRAQIIGSTLRVKVWGGGGTEPVGWTVTATSTAITAAGRTGVRSILAAGNTNALPVYFAYDDWAEPAVGLSASTTPTLDGVWIKSIARPFLNRQVTVRDYSDVSRRARAGVFDVKGRSFPVAVTDVRGSRQWSLDVSTYSAQERSELDLLLASGDILLVQVPADAGRISAVPSGYVTVGDTREATPPTSDLAMRVFSLPCTEVAAPGADVVGATVTCQGVLVAYATCSAVLAAQPTCLSLLELIGDPTDVVVP